MTSAREASMTTAQRRLSGTALAVGLAATLAGAPALLDARQSASPPPGSPVAVGLADLPIIPDPAECAVAPLPYADLATAVAGDMTPDSESTPATTTGSASADPAQVDGVMLTLRLQIACVNAGDLPRALALTGGAYRAQVIAPVGVPSEGQYAALATPVPVSVDGLIGVLAVDEVVALPDGRITARVATLANGVTTTSMVTFSPSTSSPTGWLITGQDRLSRVDANGTPVA